MRARRRAALAAAGLLLALAAGAFGRAHERLAAWYDVRDGLGAPCAGGPVRAYDPGADFELLRPVCWKATAVSLQGLKVHQFEDPAPGLGSLSVWAATSSDRSSWRLFEADVRAAEARSGGRSERRGPLKLVRASGTSGEPSDAWLMHEWLVDDGGRAGLYVGYRVQKVLARSPHVAAMLESIDAMVASLVVWPRAPAPLAQPRRLDLGSMLGPRRGRS